MEDLMPPRFPDFDTLSGLASTVADRYNFAKLYWCVKQYGWRSNDTNRSRKPDGRRDDGGPIQDCRKGVIAGGKASFHPGLGSVDGRVALDSGGGL
jgi:hypothetical protein